jgi:hypothetical protein
MFDSSHHTADLSIFSFFEDYRELRRRESCDLTWLGGILASDNSILATNTTDDTSTRSIVLELDTDTIAHLLERLILYLPVDLDNILLLMLIARMHEIVREAPVIGQYDKSCSLLIETTNWKYSLRYIDHIHDTLLIVLARETSCHDITGLIVDVVDEVFCIFNNLIGYFYLICFWIYNLTDMRYNTIY